MTEELKKALWTLTRVHLREVDAPEEFHVIMGATPEPICDRNEYVQAWATVRAALRR